MGFERQRFRLTLIERIRAFLFGTYSVMMWKFDMDSYELKLKKCVQAKKGGKDE